MDVHDLITGEYRLEISSPGIPRPLFYPEQFKRFVGQEVQLRLSHPILARRKWSGVIVAVDSTTLTLVCDGAEHAFIFSNILKANLVAERGEA
ncbi:MAG: hypothetical protein B7X00_00700 [Legionella sp. 21-45-4]|nr:MAG: hypothetical protein B7X00_00700 [Legionella sp. 21-45-4]